MASQRQSARLSLWYSLFFLFIEPLSALLGAWKAHFDQIDYLSMTAAGHPTAKTLSIIPPLHVAETVSLSQLANLYLLFSLNEAVVLRSTADLRVWRALLFGLLVADLGHLYALRPLGHATYWKFWDWNAMAIGNVGFVYVGAATRLCFLLGVGIRAPEPSAPKTKAL